MNRIILASQSPRRRELIRSITDNYEVIAAPVEEILPEGLPAEQAPVYLARLKARAVAGSHPGRVVIGADTVVILDNKVLGKPLNAADAAAMLRMLSGRVHTVITGCCLAFACDQCDTVEKTFSQTTLVRFYPLSEREIEAYIATGEPMDKAGSYGIQGKGAALVARIEGSYDNVVGLPLITVYNMLMKLQEIT